MIFCCLPLCLSSFADSRVSLGFGSRAVGHVIGFPCLVRSFCQVSLAPLCWVRVVPIRFSIRTHASMLAVEYVLHSLGKATIGQKVMAEDIGIERLAYLLRYHVMYVDSTYITCDHVTIICYIPNLLSNRFLHIITKNAYHSPNGHVLTSFTLARTPLPGCPLFQGSCVVTIQGLTVHLGGAEVGGVGRLHQAEHQLKHQSNPGSLSGERFITCAASWMPLDSCLDSPFFGRTLQTHGIGPGLRMRYRQTAHHKLGISRRKCEAIGAEILIKTAGSS